MAVTRSTRLGRVLPGTAISTRTMPMSTDPLSDPTGGVTLTDADTGGSASGAAAVMRANELRRQFDIEQETAAKTLERQRAGTLAQAQFLQSQLQRGIPETVLQSITDLEKTGTENIGLQYNALLNELAKRRQQGLAQVGAGYGTLATYLQQNAPQAFAQAQRAMPEVTQSALGQYMAGQGVSPAVAQEAAQLANVQAAGGAANFNQLLNVLAAREAAAQQSRLAEAEMARAAGVTGLESIYGAGTAQLEQAKLAAINELAARIGQARLQTQTQQVEREQALQNALAGLLGTGLITPEQITGAATPAQTPTPTETAPRFGRTPEGFVTSPAVSALLDTAAARRTDKPTAVTNRIWNFVEANPGATKKQVLDEFPNLKGLDSLKTKKKK